MTEQEIKRLREEIFADGKVTKEEVLDLWERKDAQEETTCTFDLLFAEAVMAWLLADGKIDEEEAQFLVDKISEDGDIDDAEAELLESLCEWSWDEGHEIPTILMEAFPDFFEG